MTTPRYDAIVIGTGFGGSVMTLRLAEAGVKVLAIERGPWWGRGGDGQSRARRRAFPRGLRLPKLMRNMQLADRARPRQVMVNPDGLFEMHRYDNLNAWVGSGVGGGSLVYTNMQVRAEPGYADHFPEALAADDLAAGYDRVYEMLSPTPTQPVPKRVAAFAGAPAAEPVEYPDLAILQGPPHAPKDHVNAQGVRQTSCNHCGECIVGCTTGSKNTLDLNYLPAALKAGARINALTEVRAITPVAGGYRLGVYDFQRRKARSFEAGHVFFCAGTLNTLRLLLRARFVDRSLPALSPALGQGVTGNGDMATIIFGSREIRDNLGSSITAFRRFYEEDRYRYLVAEGGIPAGALPAVGRFKFSKRSALLLGMGKDAADGVASLRSGHLHVDFGHAHDPGYFEALSRMSRRLAEAYRGRSVWTNFPNRAGSGTVSTVHPLGGAVSAETAAQGVVNAFGEVFGYPGLYVADGAALPAPPGVPPSMTIAAFAEWVASSFLLRR